MTYVRQSTSSSLQPDPQEQQQTAAKLVFRHVFDSRLSGSEWTVGSRVRIVSKSLALHSEPEAREAC